MRHLTPLNTDWHFHISFSDSLIAQKASGTPVRLPHNAVDLEMNYFDERCYQKEFAYQTILTWQAEFEGKEIALRFDGSMANTVVWINGQQVARHRDGYTPFEARLTGLLHAGENLVTVKVDGSENPEIPPLAARSTT